MNELIMSGLQLMALGMGVVFLFLGLLVGVISIVSKVIRNLEDKPQPVPSPANENEELLEVIKIAVKNYRTDHPN